MKLKLVSDLHLEFSDIVVNNDHGCDVLLMAGDIMVARHLDSGSELGDRFRNFLERVNNDFDHVLYIAGNHEFYRGVYPGSLDAIREAVEPYPRITFLDRSDVTLGDVTFLGTTLWTDMNRGDWTTMEAVRSQINDFRLIRLDQQDYRLLRPEDTAIEHRLCLDYISSRVDHNPDRKFVVLGHHAPSTQSIHETFREEIYTNGAYSSDLSEFILDRPQIKLWVHGHTHIPFDYRIGETRVVCNPRGYEGHESPTGWDPNIVIEV